LHAQPPDDCCRKEGGTQLQKTAFPLRAFRAPAAKCCTVLLETRWRCRLVCTLCAAHGRFPCVEESIHDTCQTWAWSVSFSRRTPAVAAACCRAASSAGGR